MTEQQTDRERLRAEAAQNAPYGMVISTGETLALLDQLDQAEARIGHLEATAQVLVKEVLDAENARDESRRGKVEAEARIKAVRDALDVDEHVTKQMGTLGQWRPDVPAIAHDTIRRALDG